MRDLFAVDSLIKYFIFLSVILNDGDVNLFMIKIRQVIAYDIVMSQYIDFLHEVFELFGVITTRRMFGGYGIYHQGLMFGLVADDELYLKVDKTSISVFDERNLAAFEYDKNGKVMQMSYHKAPEEIFDEPEQANYWANLAYDAAIRANKK